MSFGVKAAKNNLITLITGTTGLQAVYDGAPESMPTKTSAWVTLGDVVQPAQAVASGGLYELTTHLIIVIGHAVEGAEEVAEDYVCDAVDEIIVSILTNRTHTVNGVAPMLGGTVKTMDPPGPAAMPSDYVTIAGQPARIYPLAIEIRQRLTIT